MPIYTPLLVLGWLCGLGFISVNMAWDSSGGKVRLVLPSWFGNVPQ